MCEHDNWGIDEADPSVGILTPVIWCEDCGAYALEHHEEQDDEYSAPYIVVDKWGKANS